MLKETLKVFVKLTLGCVIALILFSIAVYSVILLLQLFFWFVTLIGIGMFWIILLLLVLLWLSYDIAKWNMKNKKKRGL